MSRLAHRPANRLTLAVFLIGILTLMPVPYGALADDRDIAERQAQQRELERAARALRDDVEVLRLQLVQTASRIQARERAANDDEARLGELKLRRHALAANFDRRRGELTDLLGALERVALRPPALLLADTRATSDHLRGALILGTIITTLERDAADLRSQLSELDELRTRIADEQVQLDKLLAALRQEKVRLSELVSAKNRQRAELSASARAEAIEIAALAAKARNTRDLLSRLEAREAAKARERGPVPRPAERIALAVPTPRPKIGAPTRIDAVGQPPRTIRFADARGNLMQPAAGKVIANYGRPDGSGGVRKGISIRTRESADVVAPFGGKVVFAGPFAGYGELLILEAGDGYHILMSGMSSVHGEVGQYVVPGEPIGRMGVPAVGDKSGRTPSERSNSDLRDLYVEFRKDGEPFNPLPWMATGTNKVSG